MPSVPRVKDLMWPTMRALKALDGSGSNEELLAKVVELEDISEAVQAVPHKNGSMSRLAYNLAWTRTMLKRAGAITNSERGVWSITSAGEKMTEAEVSSSLSRARKNDREKRRNRKLANDQFGDEEAEDPSSDWKGQLLMVLLDMEAGAFEKLTQRLLRESGFVKVEVTGRAGDGGIDGQGILRMNLISFQIFFQCKKYRGTVGAGAMRDFRGAMQGRGDKGLFVTTGTFSNSARQEATRDGAPAIDLIDGDALCELLKGLELGVRTELVEKITIEPEVFASI
jgi:restriction system protein